VLNRAGGSDYSQRVAVLIKHLSADEEEEDKEMRRSGKLESCIALFTYNKNNQFAAQYKTICSIGNYTRRCGSSKNGPVSFAYNSN